MNIALWVIQVLIAFQSVSGGVWRITNYQQAARQIASVQALPVGGWMALGGFEILCALGLILPGLLHVMPNLTPIAAACLTVELLVVAGFHAYHGVYGAAGWCAVCAILSAFVAYGRFVLAPL